ncbi:MAG TPA: lysophospholipid acyltransferase family protein [Anaeromyxobacteraceae bacterium]|nr:lysophospholipid acyltransferase family protein [Anaeromyxobacteraceae bacterium]
MSELGAVVRGSLRALTFELGGPGSRERLAKLEPARNEYGVDPYGFDVDYAMAAMAPFLWLYRKYFRVLVHGIEKVPQSGRLLIIANHSGQLPFDAAMLGLSLLVELDPPRYARALVERWVPRLPFVSSFYARLGQVVGTPENCRRLLAAEEALLVFPEGVRGLCKPFWQSYRLKSFGVGFMRLALETGTPIVPVGIVGAEEQAPALLDLKPLARLLAMPALPLTPTPLALPLPTRYHLHFGEPLRFKGSPDDEDHLLEGKVEEVKGAIEKLLAKGLKERRHIFW